jgi:hypothetical protein
VSHQWPADYQFFIVRHLDKAHHTYIFLSAFGNSLWTNSQKSPRLGTEPGTLPAPPQIVLKEEMGSESREQAGQDFFLKQRFGRRNDPNIVCTYE